MTIAPGPTGAQVGRPQDTGGPAWSGGGLPGTGPSSAGELAKLISGWKPPKKPIKPKPPAGAVAQPSASPQYELQTHGDVDENDVAEVRHAIECSLAPVLEVCADREYKFTFARDLASFDPGIAAQSPRGWPEGTTWANADGYCSHYSKTILATREYKDFYTGKVIESHRRIGVMRHETGTFSIKARASFRLVSALTFSWPMSPMSRKFHAELDRESSIIYRSMCL